MTAPARSNDWVDGPARWAAASVLGLASIIGLAVALSPGRTPVDPHVPALAGGEAAPAAVDPGNTGEPGGPPDALDRGRIDINTASAAELELLPRIGTTLAARIVEHRETHGPFGSLDDLDDVRGIGPRTLDQLRPYAIARPTDRPRD